MKENGWKTYLDIICYKFSNYYYYFLNRRLVNIQADTRLYIQALQYITSGKGCSNKYILSRVVQGLQIKKKARYRMN